MTTRISLIAAAAAIFVACGGVETDSGFEESTEALTAYTLEGKVLAMGTAQRGAVVQAFDATGRRLARATSDANGTYRLSLSVMPARVLATAVHHPPRALQNPTFTISSNKAKLDVDVGPWLDGDFTAENRAYFVTRSTTAPKIIRTVSWGLGGGLGSPWDEASDLLAGPRHQLLTSLLPAGVKLVPNVEQGIVEKSSSRGRYLEARFSEQLDTYNLGAAGTGQLFAQLVWTISHADGRGLPVRLRVRCTTCSGGYKDIKDGHIGADGPDGSYRPTRTTVAAGFTDIRTNRYADHITMAKELGLLPAADTAATTFKPDTAATRAFTAELLVRALQLTLVNPTTARFSDVPRTHASFKAIETAAQSGALTGAGTTFRPTGTLTRAELAGFLANAAKWVAPATPTESFTDVPRAYWAFARIETAFGYCRAVESRGGPADTNFRPGLTATRAEVTAGVIRMMNCFNGGELGAK